MNRIFSVIWNHSLSAWVVASEQATRQGKRGTVGTVAQPEHCGPLRALSVAIALSLGSVSAVAADLPTGGNVVLGSGQILTPDQQQMIINQSSNKLAIDWQSFNIGADKKVTFVQPGKDSVALNRVVGSDGSKIMGQLNANGQVFLVNPNGVLFGKGSSVDVGGLVASTRDISNSNFAAGNYTFEGKGDASVVNQGSIKAADGGAVALLGGSVSNEGVIAAKLGTVALAAGNKITLDFAGDGLLNVQIDEATKNALVENKQLIQANGGQVIMTAKASDALLQTVVNNTGVIEAQTLGQKGGKIVLLGGFDGGTVQVAGTLDASAPTSGNGGFIDTSGAHVQVADTAKITTSAPKGKTGKWLIDPTDFTIAASGGNTTGAALSNQLKNTDISIATVASGSAAGNINVNDTVTWNANTLTFTAHNNVIINKEMFGSGSAKLAVEYGQGAVAAGNTSSILIKAPINLAAGQNYSTRQGSNGTRVDYTVITSLGAMGSVTGLDLQGINGALSRNFVLGANIDAASTVAWNAGAGFDSLGTLPTGAYTGTFDGLGHTVSNLNINRTQKDSGLFGALGLGAIVRNVGLLNAKVALTGVTSDVFPAVSSIGALVGYNNGRVENSYANGAVSSLNYVQLGGLVGTNEGTVNNSWFGGTVTDANWAGAAGLVGLNRTSGVISNSYSTATVTSTLTSAGGGLVYRNEGLISGSSATGAVTSTRGGSYTAGLVARNLSTGVIINSYATGNVVGSGTLGGLVGQNLSGGQISNSYATGNVSINGFGSGSYNGGLVGNNAGTLTNVYSTGSVSGSLVNTANNGGLVGINGGNITNAYSVGKVTSSGAGGLIGRHSGGTLTNAYYNSTVNNGLSGLGNDSSTGSVGAGAAVGLTTTQMQNKANFVGFGFTTTPGATGNTWVMVNADSGGVNNGTAGTLPMLSSEYSTTITNAHQLQLMAADPNASYVLGRDIVAGATAGSSDVWYGSFIPVGAGFAQFFGRLDGQGHVIYNLTINRSGVFAVGLFGALSNSSVVRNLGLNGGSIRGSTVVGAVAGQSDGLIEGVFSTATVAADSYAGGLVGYIESTGRISNSYASGVVTAEVSGGLVGLINSGTIDNSLASGLVTGTQWAGGLVGSIYSGSVTGSFWNTSTTAQTSGFGPDSFSFNGATGLTTGQLQSGATLRNAGWDLNNTWTVYDGKSGPLLRSFMTQLTVDASHVSKTYDGLAYTANVPAVSNPLLLGTLVVGGTAQGAINAGDYSLQLSGLYSTDQQGYLVNYVDGTLSVNQAVLTQSGVNVSKTYNGTTAATINDALFNGVVAADRPNLMFSAEFADKNVGTANLVNLSLSGTAAGNYRFDPAVALTGTIMAKALTLSGLAVSDKVYDGSRGATLSGGTLLGMVGSETLGISGLSGLFDSKNVGTGQAVTLTGVSLGNGTGLVSNYSLDPVTGITGSIIAKALTLDGVSAADKVYNGNRTATLSGGVLSGLVNGETLGFNVLAADFDDKNAGTDKTVTVVGTTLSDGSGLASNYSISNPTGITANITPKALTLAGVSASDKVYDGSTAAQFTSSSFDGFVGVETLTFNGITGAFNDKNVGTGKSITLTANLSDGSGLLSNYRFISPIGLTANITAKALTLSGVNASGKVYDGNTVAALSGGTLDGLVGNETLDVSGLIGEFDNQNVGTAKTVTLTGATLVDGNALASNYSLSNPTGVSADITAKALTLSGVSANGKVYDGNTVATFSGGTLNGLVGSETLGTTIVGDFTDKNVGAGKTINLAGTTLINGSGLASNYSLSTPAGLSADITPKSLSVTGITANNKVYDATVAATLNLSVAGFTGLVNGDNLSLLSASGAFSDKNAATGKTVAVSAITLSGADVGNYQWTDSTTSANISKATLNVTVADSRKAQGLGNPAFFARYQGLQGNDTVDNDLAGSLAFSTQATAQSTGGQYNVSASGQSSSNYDIAYTDGLLTVDAPLLAPLATVTEVVEPLRTLPKPTLAPVLSAPQLPSDLYTLIDQGLRLPEGL